MTLIDIEKLEYEPFNVGEEGDAKLVNYISEEAIRNAPKVDPVNHAEWVMETHPMITKPNDTYIRFTCSHCGRLGVTNIIPTTLWDQYYKGVYETEHDPFCRKCGYKMDLRELYDKYRLDWCNARGYILEAVEQYGGANGECYACFDEWYNNEYRESRGE